MKNEITCEFLKEEGMVVIKRSIVKNSSDQQNTSCSSYNIRSRNTFGKITSTKIQLLM